MKAQATWFSFLVIFSVVLAGAARPAFAADSDVRDLADAALNGPADEADKAALSLRAKGPAAMESLLAMRREWIERIYVQPDLDIIKNTPESLALAEKLPKLDALIDRVAGQRYASVSGLYWHTDFDRAKAAAEASGKPILSLRMLGNLTDEFSCANSRFFRTTLYANAEVAKVLRERFVLHWKSVRPVPRVTIDFGDGRRIERTITGNSAHHVLDAEGRPLDVLPGLFGPEQFLAWLGRVEKLHAEVKGLPLDDPAIPLLQIAGDSEPIERWVDLTGEFKAKAIRRYHAERQREIILAWAEDLSAVLPDRFEFEKALAVDLAQLNEAMSDEVWLRLAALPRHAVALDRPSVELIRSELPPSADRAGEIAVTKKMVESPILRLLPKLQSSIALDSVKNEYALHRRIHEWFLSQNAVDREMLADADALNERVYAELFLTPSNDPWLGLAPPDEYTALKRGGVVQPKPVESAQPEKK